MLRSLAISIALLLCHVTLADVTNLHFRTGTISGSMSSENTESFSVAPTMEVEYEKFYRLRRSYAFRALMAMDQGTAKVFYYGATFGQRFYYSGFGYDFTRSFGNVAISSRDKLKSFVFYDAGLSQAIVKTFGDLFQAVTMMVEISGGGGINYQVSRYLGIDARLSLGYGYGFSSVAVAATLMSIQFGLNYSF